ncbi:BlaI/MecI/CopY family transcriptional regulator [Anaerofilum sp. BX8]|uniref:BlaI/MecI/CopY family transcriptional regulator n=1 Tax=Anaerofilum hominis TaxID=2763016 RepID=A0A923L1E5_9FIRM|nr:BlaI/MecI/CopY family transcriptional regulator [Anaerofilum hominis]MBC5582140.1 BlaI/MecI/CopY family transcriptional regulator [Anaerofilum hominis]
MEDYRLGEMEQKFADLIWERAPVASGELVRLCAAAFGWKKSTTYTMLKRLCQRGLFENRGGRVQALTSKEEFCARRGEQFLEESFGGSLPRFFAAFTRHNRLSGAEVEELRQMIEAYGEIDGAKTREEG